MRITPLYKEKEQQMKTLYNGIEYKLCNLCDDCGFLNTSQVGILDEALGLVEILNNQTLFMCHKHLQAFNGSTNTGTEDYLEEHDSIYVCSGLIQSLKKTGVHPRNDVVRSLISKVTDIDDRVMTKRETLNYHKVQQ